MAMRGDEVGALDSALQDVVDLTYSVFVELGDGGPGTRFVPSDANNCFDRLN
jgi:hypothetical protein